MEEQTAKLPVDRKTEAIRYFREAIASGKNWYISLLEAIGLWTDCEEVNHGRHYSYLISREAFDWLLLAERLCGEMDGFVPEDEKLSLLFKGKSPVKLEPVEFKELIGNHKYKLYLNYFYGITIEESLILAVHEEVCKEHRNAGNLKDSDFTDEAYHRIYGATHSELLEKFRKEKDYPQLKSITTKELKEFTYWLFKYRLEHCDRVKVASDTQKGLERFRKLQALHGASTTVPEFGNGD